MEGPLAEDEFHGVSPGFPLGFPRKLEGVVGKRAGNTERKPGRVREETLGKAKMVPSPTCTFHENKKIGLGKFFFAGASAG